MQTSIVEILNQVRAIDPFPEVANKVLALSNRDDVIPSDLIEVIQVDAILTAKVLRLCNSAYYGFRREIASLQEAGNLLGVHSIVNLVLTSTTKGYFNSNSESGAGKRDQWQKCVANALSSRLVARLHGRVDEERAYTVGLLQNIGHLVLEPHLTAETDALRWEVAKGANLFDAEHTILGLQHAEIGARMAQRWGLPNVLIDTIRYHHAPHRATEDPVLAATNHLAETLRWAVGLGDGIGDLSYDVAKSALALTGLSTADFLGLDEVLAADLGRAQGLIDG
jgi:HD-like signal output (HDOD) protein